MTEEHDYKEFSEKSNRIISEIKKDIIGQSNVVEETIIAMVAGGNVLLEGVPGVGKTRLVRSLGRAFSLPFSRIQFTPDLMPADVTGTDIIVKNEHGNSEMQFQPGPIFSSIVLADEINRATPKTQSALLEAMQEHTVTVSGESRKLDDPFFVLATQNPIEQDGTYPLPEAQMDRFMFKLVVGMPTVQELASIVDLTQHSMEEFATAVMDGPELLQMREASKNVPVIDEVMKYAMKLVASTHPDGANASDIAKRYIKYGSSPRGAQNLITAAKVRALMEGRYNVSYNDINTLAFPVLRHRIKLNFEAVTTGIKPDAIITALIEELKTGKVPIKERIASKKNSRNSRKSKKPANAQVATARGAK